MTNVTVLCGKAAHKVTRGKVLRLDVDGPEGGEGRINLQIGQLTRPMLANLPDRIIDLIEIAAYVYAADQFVSRGGSAMTGMGRDWRRAFRLVVPVRDVSFWQSPQTWTLLTDSLGFLSDDHFKFDFVPANSPRKADSYLDLDGDGAPVGFVPDKVALFSGGLDSLAGAAVSLLQRRESMALVSHHSAKAIHGRQSELAAHLKARAPPARLFHVGVTVTKGTDEAHEFTQRTRSFLFACLGFAVAHLFRKEEIFFFENGVVSLNLPVADHIVGTRATRTTHPKVLADFGALFSRIAGKTIAVLNPFFWLTRAEVLQKLADAGAADLIARSFSCSHVRLAVSRGQQCGICTQCLDRRFAILAAGLEAYDSADNYAVDLLTGERKPGPEVVLAESYVLSAGGFATMTETAFLARHGQVFRALPYLDGPHHENAAHIHDMHRRHGRAITGVLDKALRAMTMQTLLDLPRTSLLALVRAPFGSPAPVRDPTELEPPPAQQAEALRLPRPIPRPIFFHIDHTARRVTLAGSIRLSRAFYDLVAALMASFLADQHAGRTADAFCFVSSADLAKRLEKTPEALRQLIHRFRKKTEDEFRDQFGHALAEDDIIQNREWAGYRLSPHLALQAAIEPDANRAA